MKPAPPVTNIFNRNTFFGCWENGARQREFGAFSRSSCACPVRGAAGTQHWSGPDGAHVSTGFYDGYRYTTLGWTSRSGTACRVSSTILACRAISA